MSKLQRARSVALPTREEILRRDPSVQDFWSKNNNLFKDAWNEWDQSQNIKLNPLASLLDEKLNESVLSSWQTPSNESIVKRLLKEISPGVYSFQLFNPKKIYDLRNYLKETENAKIPLRPPYGIALNRNGAMLDRRSPGNLAAPSFQSLYEELINKYMRPIARLIFPEIIGYDTQTFGFSIQYQAGVDTSLRMHTDASAVTLNINLNLPEEKYTGSEVDFHNSKTNKLNRVKFEPGEAIIHRGNVAHQAQPIIKGLRSNLVLWLYGDKMQIPYFGSPNEEPSAEKRWTIPSAIYDDYAPF